MAATRTFLLLDVTGAPLTTASPTFVDYRNRSGVSRTAPSNPVHIGGGVYAYTPSNADEIAGTVALVDGGSSAYPQRDAKAIYLADSSNQFWAWHVEDTASALWAGGAPTVGVYQDSVGTARTAPSPAAISGAYLWALTPSGADIAAQTTARIDAPAGSGWPYLLAATEIITTGGGGSVPATPSPAPSTTVFVANALARPLIDGGSDVLVFPGLDETFTLVNDGRVLAEALARRLTTPRGTLPFHADYGLDLRGYLNESMTQDVLYRLKAAVERECELDERVLTASATVSYAFGTQALGVRISVTTSNGPFKFVLNVTSLTVQMLGEE